jgi:hypothetical protein
LTEVPLGWDSAVDFEELITGSTILWGIVDTVKISVTGLEVVVPVV